MRTSTTKYSIYALLILGLLREKSMYNYEMAQIMSKNSEGLLEVKYTALTSTLNRLLENGYITADKEQIVNNRIRVYYHIQEKGLLFLDELKSVFKNSVYGICDILDWDVSFTEKAE